MMPRRKMSLVLARAGWHRMPSHGGQQPLIAAVAVPHRSFSVYGDGSSNRVDEDPNNDELLLLEDEYSTLKVNWFPGHMVKATKIIREKLKQVDMVFEVRDARIPFTSANDDLDKIVGPSKARLIILNKADLSNQALEQRVLQRFREQGKSAVYACGRTGANVNKLLAWARERGARRGEFSTTGAVAMVVGMPNVGKSSLINLLRGKANSRGGGGGGGGGSGEGTKQVARVGAMPGVTRQVSAFRIASNPPLYLVDTPGVMVPRVERVTAGLFLALTRAVPDSVVPPDILVGFMLRIVRSRRLSGTAASANARGAAAKGHRQQQPRRSKAIAAWLLQVEGSAGPKTADEPCRADSDHDEDTEDRAVATATATARKTRQRGTHEYALEEDDREEEREDREREEDMEALLEAVERESGAEGKPAPEARRICCRFLLDAFRDGQFGRTTLDSVPRRRARREDAAEYLSGHPRALGEGWAQQGLVDRQGEAVDNGGGGGGGGGGDGTAGEKSDRVTAGGAGARDRRKPPRSPDEDVAERLVRDWSSADAWERAEAGRT